MQLPSKATLERDSSEFAAIYKHLYDAGVPIVTAVVMAGDIQSANRADELVKQGVKPRDVVWFIGSFARFDWAVRNLPKRTFFSLLPELWVASDPDDTKPSYLELWHEAHRRNGGRTITDGEALPDGHITIYRGQVGGGFGISWTLDRGVAEKFALSGGGRGIVSGGKVLRRRIHSRQALAYLTKRNESEVIYDGQA